ncbi:MAG: alpha/beta hydrolase [Clostridiales bacterium]|nr:alpha/beta hydrolase [Clostridiales bacterium]
MNVLSIILLCIGISLPPFGLFMILFTAWRIFVNTLYRDDKKPRSRDASPDSSDEQKEMFAKGLAWAERHRDKITDLHIVNDGLNLYAQYIDLGFDKCAALIQGRTESLQYSYYYADVYAENGYNILVIDTRAHGLSDGKYITAGIQEQRDLVAWIDLIHERYGIENFTVHGICIGAATAVYAYCASREKGLIQKIVTDGLFISYHEIFEKHIVERNKPVFCFVHLTFFYTWLCTGARLLRETPLRRMPEIDIPILFIWSRTDFYCQPHNCEALFAACASPKKEMRLFPDGKHSHVRYCNTEEYDAAVNAFLQS